MRPIPSGTPSGPHPSSTDSTFTSRGSGAATSNAISQTHSSRLLTLFIRYVPRGTSIIALAAPFTVVITNTDSNWRISKYSLGLPDPSNSRYPNPSEQPASTAIHPLIDGGQSTLNAIIWSTSLHR